MPSGSILINDGRRSASPDRRVTFGNIERYDIMTSNEIKNNMHGAQKNTGNNIVTATGSYVLTRLDNRIRKSIMLGFCYMPGDTVTYDEVIDFLLEFKVIANGKICTERQVTILIQSLYPSVVIKPSMKHKMIYVNLENRSDDVVKEELVRVTTEPIVENNSINASFKANEWIQDEVNGYKSDEEDDNAELALIEDEKFYRENKFAFTNCTASRTVNHAANDISVNKSDTGISSLEADTGKLDYMKRNIDTERVVERGIDIPENLPQLIVTGERNKKNQGKLVNNKKNEELFENELFRKKNKLDSVNQISSTKSKMTVTAKSRKNETETEINGKTGLQRNRSFTKSTDQSFVGSIREKFRSTKTKTKEVPIEIEAKDKQKKTSNPKNFTKPTVSSSKKIDMNKPIRRPASVNDISKPIGRAVSVNDIRSSVKPINVRRNVLSSSSIDISNKQTNRLNPLNRSSSAIDVKTVSSATKVVRRASMKKENKEINVIARATDARSSLRKAKEEESAFKKASVRSSLRISSAEGKERVKKNMNSPRQANPKVKRRDSTRLNKTSTNSSSSSNASTPSISRENSNVSCKSNNDNNNNNNSNDNITKRNPRLKELPQQEKDLIRIAKAFQQASKTIDIAKDKIEDFMIAIATKDLSQSPNYHLKLDDLYDHIHRKMIDAKEDIFDDRHTDDITVDMSRYFDLLFKVLASHFDRIGCEMLRDQATNEKICYLTHVEINDYQLSSIMEVETEDMIASYV